MHLHFLNYIDILKRPPAKVQAARLLKSDLAFLTKKSTSLSKGAKDRL
jgi:hypothetical protein